MRRFYIPLYVTGTKIRKEKNKKRAVSLEHGSESRIMIIKTVLKRRIEPLFC